LKSQSGEQEFVELASSEPSRTPISRSVMAFGSYADTHGEESKKRRSRLPKTKKSIHKKKLFSHSLGCLYDNWTMAEARLKKKFNSEFSMMSHGFAVRDECKHFIKFAILLLLALGMKATQSSSSCYSFSSALEVKSISGLTSD
jgi:hypothetical protein